MKPKTARDIMVPLEDYPHAYETQTLREAVRLLETADIQFDGRTSMPRVLLVFDANNKLLGKVRRRDIMRGLEPDFHPELSATHPELHFQAEIDPNLSELMDADDTDRIHARLDRPLSEVVIDLEGRVNAEDSLMKVVREMVGDDTHLVVVLENDQVIGVVRTLDLLPAVCEGLF